MKEKILDFPVIFEPANSKLDNKTLLRIIILVLAFVFSFAGYTGLLKVYFNHRSLDEGLPIGYIIATAFVAVPILFYLVIFLGSWLIIRFLPSDTIYRFTAESIEIRSRSEKEIRTFPNNNISNFIENESGFEITSAGQAFHLPKLVNPMGTGIKLIVIPISQHTGLTFRKSHTIRLVQGQLRIVAVWDTDFKSSRYTN